MKYDLIIVGAGPAGLTAGIYAARSGLKTAIISGDIGGTVNSILRIENWPGYSGTGTELMKKFHEQLKKYKVVASLMAGRLQWILQVNETETANLDNTYQAQDFVCPISADSSDGRAHV